MDTSEEEEEEEMYNDDEINRSNEILLDDENGHTLKSNKLKMAYDDGDSNNLILKKLARIERKLRDEIL